MSPSSWGLSLVKPVSPASDRYSSADGNGLPPALFRAVAARMPFGGHRHFMPLHYWLKRCNCLLKFATC